jgi:hypothetical protein
MIMILSLHSLYREVMDHTDSDDICAICGDKLDVQTLIRLLCFHAYHYDCILQWYKKLAETKHGANRSCPFCRKNGGFLPHKYGTEFHKNINYDDGTRKNPDRNTTLPTCQAIIQSKASKNYGNICGKLAYNNGYCGRHHS